MSRLRNIPGSVEVINGSSFVVHDPEAKKGSWKQIFHKEQPLYIEIGMGKGRFLMDMAAAHPECNFIGIEMYDSVLFRALQKAETRALLREDPTAVPEEIKTFPATVTEGRPQIWEDCNFRFLRMDASDLLKVFEKGEIDGIYLNFSDPWPKDRHAGRRLTSRNFLKLYEQVLAPEAVLAFKTDNRALFDFSLEEVQDYGWELLAHTFDLHHDDALNEGNIMTEYEEKFSAKGNPICKLIARPR